MHSLSLIRTTIFIIVLYLLADISFNYFLETKTSFEVLLQTMSSILTQSKP